MISVYLPELEIKEKDIVVEGNPARHLIKSLRIKLGDKVLLLNDSGAKFYAEVNSVEKKALSLEILEEKKLSRKFNVDLALCMPKKEAFELSLRMSVEMGVSEFIPIKTSYSQLKDYKTDRALKIIESAVVQSNNPFGITYNEFSTFDKLIELSAKYDQVVYFSSFPREDDKLNVSADQKILYIIGPEGGLSKEEELALETLKNLKVCHLPTSILRTPTAVAVGLGHILGSI